MSLSKPIPEVAGLIAALVVAGGCDTLKISNPNAPDTPHLLASPASVEAVAIGAMKTWYLTSQGGLGEDQYPSLTLAVMARSHVTMWNNFHIRFYTGCTDGTQPGAPLPWNGYTSATNGTCGPLPPAPGNEGPSYARAEWQNNPAAAERTQIEARWYGFYASLSSARDVLKRIRVDGLTIKDAATTKMVETVTVLAQALSLGSLALNYDHAFIVDYNTDLATLTCCSTAVQVRDAAMAKFDEAIALANANTFTTDDGFFGPGVTYSNVRIAQIANTMAARTLAYFARNSIQNAAVDWVRVKNYAANGISAGAAPFDLIFHQDACNTWCDFLKVWSNDMNTVRVHARVAHLMDAAKQPDPYDPALDLKPSSPDKRLGDGTFRAGAGAYATSIQVDPDLTGNGGYDFAWTPTGVFGRTNRGVWHQSAVGQVRYDSLTGSSCTPGPTGSSSPGNMDSPMVLAAESDLIWAEALLRQPAPDPGTAATLINYTHAGPNRLGRPRGGLTPSTGTLADVQYEQDVELIGSNDAPYFNQRRIDNLEPFTPHEMPIPAKELGVLGLPLYTCGGAAHPDGSCDAFPAAAPPAARVQRWWAGIVQVRTGIAGAGAFRR